MTFRQCAKRYVAAHAAGWRNRGRHRLASLSAYVFAVFGEGAAAAVDLPLVMQATGPIWRAKPVTANNVRNRVAMVPDGAQVHGLRPGEPGAGERLS